MPRSATYVQLEIDALEALLGSSASTFSSVGSDGQTVTYASRKDAQNRLDQLYGQLQRINRSSMWTRGRVTGIGNDLG